MLKAGTVILERDSWSWSFIPRLSNTMFWVIIQVEHQHKASVFDNLGMTLNNQPPLYIITFPTFNLSILHKSVRTFHSEERNETKQSLVVSLTHTKLKHTCDVWRKYSASHQHCWHTSRVQCSWTVTNWGFIKKHALLFHLPIHKREVSNPAFTE